MSIGPALVVANPLESCPIISKLPARGRLVILGPDKEGLGPGLESSPSPTGGTCRTWVSSSQSPPELQAPREASRGEHLDLDFAHPGPSPGLVQPGVKYLTPPSQIIRPSGNRKWASGFAKCLHHLIWPIFHCNRVYWPLTTCQAWCRAPRIRRWGPWDDPHTPTGCLLWPPLREVFICPLEG